MYVGCSKGSILMHVVCSKVSIVMYVGCSKGSILMHVVCSKVSILMYEVSQIPLRNATPPKSAKSRNSNSSVPIQRKPKSRCTAKYPGIPKSRFWSPLNWYGVATISRRLKITGVFCRISSLL